MKTDRLPDSLKGYNTDGMGYWQGLTEEGIDFKGMKMVLIGTGGAATAIAVRGALDGIAELRDLQHQR